MRIATLLYGVAGYLYFLAVFVYAVGFVGNLVVPKSIDTDLAESAEAGSLGVAVGVNLALLSLFAVQHRVMARPAFKQWWNQFVPKPVERTTYVVFSNVVLTLLFWLWRPLPAAVWEVENAAAIVLQALFWLGWLIVLLSSFMIDHFELFGLRQTFLFFIGREAKPADFKTTFLYRYVRHPLMLGFLIAFWATRRMTAGHLLFAAATTNYILAAMQLEERDLERAFGDDYSRSRKQVSMLVPVPPRPAAKE